MISRIATITACAWPSSPLSHSSLALARNRTRSSNRSSGSMHALGPLTSRSRFTRKVPTSFTRLFLSLSIVENGLNGIRLRDPKRYLFRPRPRLKLQLPIRLLHILHRSPGKLELCRIPVGWVSRVGANCGPGSAYHPMKGIDMNPTRIVFSVGNVLGRLSAPLDTFRHFAGSVETAVRLKNFGALQTMLSTCRPKICGTSLIFWGKDTRILTGCPGPDCRWRQEP